ncbi:hypothetical protein NM688_g2925 [Phlebia brevispora]|uniref:Uncharacterized protein n=1 Tax=Phlebia brevispora TaxID=194682 RepID=A0ACC1T7W1_9APHY|nr:hypothetical protein NM688_g2925 [Phlebia brevispora]
MGVGYILLRTTAPTEEELYAVSLVFMIAPSRVLHPKYTAFGAQRMAPDLQRKVDANRAARLARESATRRQETAQLNDPDAQRPVWADPPKA